MGIEMDSLTIHGLGRVRSTKKNLMKIFWALLFLACLCGVVYSTYETLRLYFDYESYLSVTTEVKKSLALPVITMCNGLRFKSGKNTSVFTDGFDKYTDTYKRFCLMGVDICEKPKIDQSLPSCIIINPDENWKQYAPRPGMGFKMDFFLNDSDINTTSYNIYDPSIMAINIFIHSKDVDGYQVDEVVRVKPGFLTEITIKKQRFTRLQHPYISNCTVHKDKRDTYPGNYTVNGCMKRNFDTLVQSMCGNIYTKYNNTEKLSKEMNNCKINTLKKLPSLIDENVCQLPCWEVKYEVKSHYETKWPIGYEMELVKNHANRSFGFWPTDDYVFSNFGRVVIGYDQFEVLHFEERPSSSPNKLLSDIGGSMGIYLGASIISITELFVVVSTLVIALLSKIKKVKYILKHETRPVNEAHGEINSTNIFTIKMQGKHAL